MLCLARLTKYYDNWGVNHNTMQNKTLPYLNSRLISNVMPQQRVIKHGHLFAVSDLLGNIVSGNDSGLGFYASDIRFLSSFEVFLNGTQAVPLMHANKTGDHAVMVYTNQDMPQADDTQTLIAKETLQLRRLSRIQGSLFERLSIRNYNRYAVNCQLTIALEADFLDIFDVRHLDTANTGTHLPPNRQGDQLVFQYIDALNSVYKTCVHFCNFTPVWLSNDTDNRVLMAIETTLQPLERKNFDIKIEAFMPDADCMTSKALTYEDAEKLSKSEHLAWLGKTTSISTDNGTFNAMLQQSLTDLQMLISFMENSQGEKTDYLSAGIPWYVALFGRDSLIAARDCLLINPDMARNVLVLLASYQGQELNDWRDEEPGKILHELRLGELARLNKIPHTPYYGSVDATPLWLVLLHDYFIWSQDIDTLKALWPNALKALAWIDGKISADPLGFLTFITKSTNGLTNQHWKDSHDSAMHASGELGSPPLAMVEVQGYVYMAWQNTAKLAQLLGHVELSARLNQQADQFKQKFNQHFWIESMGFYAMGLDKTGQPFKVVSSNPGHCLESQIMDVDKAHKVAERLLQPDMFTGWGIRTLSTQCVRYNPMSYHNGSVWPHDNALIARGLATLKRHDLLEKLCKGIYEAGSRVENNRMPELFCGFDWHTGFDEPPVRYPSACSPQAWAASSIYAFLLAQLNFSPRFNQPILDINNPCIPGWIKHIKMKQLKIGKSVIDLELNRTYQGSVVVDVVKQHGEPVSVILEKTEH
jgi:glycogen debranching enzyme